MRTNYVLIDYENVQPESVTPLAQDHFHVLVFVGAKQPNLPTVFAASVQKLGTRAEYIVISGTAPNALDFHIAYYLGRLAAADPSAYFHIVSKDTDYVPLIQHLKSKSVVARRVKTVAEVPLANTPSPMSATDRFQAVLASLKKANEKKPRTVQALRNSISSRLRNQHITDREVESLVKTLEKQKHLSIDGETVAYPAPAARMT
jgi:hypothetical protein